MKLLGALVNQFSLRARLGVRGSMMRSLSDLRATPPTEAEVEPQDDTVETSEKKLRRLFEEWKGFYQRNYESAAHEEFRFLVFKETVREAEGHNAKVDKGEEVEYRLDYHGPFSDYTSEELAAFLSSRFGSEMETLRHPYRAKRPVHEVCRW